MVHLHKRERGEREARDQGHHRLHSPTMYSCAVAACWRAGISHYAFKPIRNVVLPRPTAKIPLSLGLRHARHFSATPLEDSSRTALVYAPDRSQLEANEEFSETDPVPPEEATLNITQAASEVRLAALPWTEAHESHRSNYRG